MFDHTPIGTPTHAAVTVGEASGPRVQSLSDWRKRYVKMWHLVPRS